MLNEGRVVIREDGKLADKEDNLLNMEAEIEKFISTVMITMKTQEDSEGFDFLTGLPMRNRGEKACGTVYAAGQRLSGIS